MDENERKLLEEFRQDWTKERSDEHHSKLEEEEIKRMGKKVPEFSPATRVIVNVGVVEGERASASRPTRRGDRQEERGINLRHRAQGVSGEGVERTSRPIPR